jgi:hypothetical protein
MTATMTRGRVGIIAVVAAIAVVVAAYAVTRSSGDSAAIKAAKTATKPFAQLSAADAAGYQILADKDGVTCIKDAGGAGAMGTHFVKGALVGDGLIDASHPEALLYDRAHNDKLMGVEYVVLFKDWKGAQPPTLFGQKFNATTQPNRFGLPPYYSLHAWLWQDNPAGKFASWNPRVDCP